MRAVSRAWQHLRVALPDGGLLEPDVWERRHRGIVVLLWLHAAGVTGFGIVRGLGLAHSALEGALVGACALAAAPRRGGRRFRASAAVLGLLTSSALLVHESGGTIEMHFHFFVMVGVITLYQDWVPFGLALAYVVVHTGCSAPWRRRPSTPMPPPSAAPGPGRSSTAPSSLAPVPPTW
jgi:hypothetical protein